MKARWWFVLKNKKCLSHDTSPLLPWPTPRLIHLTSEPSSALEFRHPIPSHTMPLHHLFIQMTFISSFSYQISLLDLLITSRNFVGFEVSFLMKPRDSISVKHVINAHFSPTRLHIPWVREYIAFSASMYPQSTALCLAHCRLSINISWMNNWDTQGWAKKKKINRFRMKWRTDRKYTVTAA